MKKIIIVHLFAYSHKQYAQQLARLLPEYDTQLLEGVSLPGKSELKEVAAILGSATAPIKKLDILDSIIDTRTINITNLEQYKKQISDFGTATALVDVNCVYDIDILETLGMNVVLYNPTGEPRIKFPELYHYLVNSVTGQRSGVLMSGAPGINESDGDFSVQYLGYVNKNLIPSELARDSFDRNRVKLLITIGTLFGNYKYLYDVIIKTLAPCCEQITLVLGHSAIDYQLPENYDNVTLMQQVDSLSDLMVEHDILFTHFGMNTLLEAIVHELPMLGMPFAFDQPFLSSAATEKGLGQAFTMPELSSEIVKACYDDLVNNYQNYISNLRQAKQQLLAIEPSIVLQKALQEVSLQAFC